MKIIRYSFDGFKPQYQSHHLKYVDYHLNEFNLNEIPTHLQFECLKFHNKIVPFFKENYNDFKYGLWAFIDGFKDNQSLNHIKKRVPCWEAKISNDTIVYHVNWDKKFKITDERCKLFGFYIPKNQLITLKNCI